MLARDKMWSGADLQGTSERWQFADLEWPICGSVITVGLRLALGSGLGLRIVVYKLLEKVTKCGSITWLKLTNGAPPPKDPPRSTFCRVPFMGIMLTCVVKSCIKYSTNKYLSRAQISVPLPSTTRVHTAIPTPVIPTPAIPNPSPNPIVSIASVGKAGAPRPYNKTSVAKSVSNASCSYQRAGKE